MIKLKRKFSLFEILTFIITLCVVIYFLAFSKSESWFRIVAIAGALIFLVPAFIKKS